MRFTAGVGEREELLAPAAATRYSPAHVFTPA